MFDAGTKIPSGIFAGNFVDLGFFEECIDIYDNATTEIIFGKYCLGVIPLFSTGQTFPVSSIVLMIKYIHNGFNTSAGTKKYATES